MGWNGGVSLAVWMGGVAVELDCARRAHLAPEVEPVPRRIYNAICIAFDRRQSSVDAWGHELVAREYRAPFRFHKPSQYQPLLLATAARASASFPGAFESFKVEGDALRVAGLVDEAPLPPAAGEPVDP